MNHNHTGCGFCPKCYAFFSLLATPSPFTSVLTSPVIAFSARHVPAVAVLQTSPSFYWQILHPLPLSLPPQQLISLLVMFPQLLFFKLFLFFKTHPHSLFLPPSLSLSFSFMVLLRTTLLTKDTSFHVYIYMYEYHMYNPFHSIFTK